MDPTRNVDLISLRRDIDETRVSIARTVGDLRQRTDEAMQWQGLIGATLCGAMIGRWLAHRAHAHRPRSDWEVEAGLSTSARATSARVPASVTASWQRLAGRVETLVNRTIDEVADVTEDVLVPTLVGGVRALLDNRLGRSVNRRTPTMHTEEGGLP